MSALQSPGTIPASDILIVGAGPAGVTASLFLTKAKIPHTIIDKVSFPRGKVDGNVYGRKVIDTLNQLDPSYFSELSAQRNLVLGCNEAQIFAPRGGSFRLRFAESGLIDHGTTDSMAFFTMNRIQFDAFLVSKLQGKSKLQGESVVYRWNTELVALEKQTDGWRVTLNHAGQHQTLEPKLIIAADGANSSTVKLLGIRHKEQRYYDFVQGYFKGVTGFEGDRHIEGHFLPEVNPGFCFMAPLADGTVNVGIGKPRYHQQQKKADLHQILQAAIAYHPNLASRFAQSEPVGNVQAWPEVIGSVQRLPLSGNGYLLTGDAAGLCNPLTGFGTGSAMLSGRLAAHSVERAVNQRTLQGAMLSDYDQALYQQLQPEFVASHGLCRVAQMGWVFNQLTGGPWKKLFKTVFKTAFRSSIQKMKQM